MSSRLKIVEASSGRIVVADLEVADSFWSRLRGLQFRRELPPHRGLLLVPCDSVHTFWMRFPVDVVVIDRLGAVLAVRSTLRPWRIVLPQRKARAILELAAGQGGDLQPGMQLRLRAADDTQVPSSLQFLRG